MVTSNFKKPLVKKLGIKIGFRVFIHNPPKNYNSLLGGIPENVTLLDSSKSPVGFMHIFTESKIELETKFPLLKRKLSQSGMIWVSWPKKSSKVKTDLNKNVVRKIGLKNNLVDVKVCSIDETWSGLKFVFRLKDRM